MAELARNFGAGAVRAMATRLGEQATELRQRSIRTLRLICVTVVLMVFLVIFLPPVIRVTEDWVLNLFGYENSMIDIERMTRDQAIQVNEAGIEIRKLIDRARSLRNAASAVGASGFAVWRPVFAEADAGRIAVRRILARARGRRNELFVGEHETPGGETAFFVAAHPLGGGRLSVTATTGRDRSIKSLDDVASLGGGFVILATNKADEPVLYTASADGKITGPLTPDLRKALSALKSVTVHQIETRENTVALAGMHLVAPGKSAPFLIYKERTADRWTLVSDFKLEDRSRYLHRIDLHVGPATISVAAQIRHLSTGPTRGEDEFKLALITVRLNGAAADAPQVFDFPISHIGRRLMFARAAEFTTLAGIDAASDGTDLALFSPDGKIVYLRSRQSTHRWEEVPRDTLQRTKFSADETSEMFHTQHGFTSISHGSTLKITLINRKIPNSFKIESGLATTVSIDRDVRNGNLIIPIESVFGTPATESPAFYAPLIAKISAKPWPKQGEFKEFTQEFGTFGTKTKKDADILAFIQFEEGLLAALRAEENWYDQELKNHLAGFDAIKTAWIAAWDKRNKAARTYHQLRTAAERSDIWRNVSSVAARLAVIALLIYLVNILVNLYRYNLRLAGFYQACSDALFLALASGKASDPNDLLALTLDKGLETFLPEKVTFGPRPETPLREIAQTVENAIKAAKPG